MQNLEEKYVSKEELFNIYHEWYQIFNVLHIRERVHTLNSIKLYIYSEDNSQHNNPHLHAYYQDQSIIIDLIDAPAQMIISGPNATFGRELMIVKNGSNTFDKNLFHQRIVAIIRDKKEHIIKEITTS